MKRGTGTFATSGSGRNVDMGSEVSHRCRRTKAMASLNVGSHLSYHMHERGGAEFSFCINPAARVIQENSPRSSGVVLAIALSDTGAVSPLRGECAPPGT